jgi:hypothetical protein
MDHAHYYTTAVLLKAAGFNAGLGHAFGVNLHYSNSCTNSAYYRTFEVDIYSWDGCEVTLLDNLVHWTDWPNNAAANYNSYTNCNAVDRGLQESGDTNQTWAADLYTNHGKWEAVNQVYRYYMLFESKPGYLVSVCNVNNAPGNSAKELLDEPFNAFGAIFYYPYTGNVAPGAYVGAGYLEYAALADLRYSFNIVNTAGSTAPI